MVESGRAWRSARTTAGVTLRARPLSNAARAVPMQRRCNAPYPDVPADGKRRAALVRRASKGAASLRPWTAAARQALPLHAATHLVLVGADLEPRTRCCSRRR